VRAAPVLLIALCLAPFARAQGDGLVLNFREAEIGTVVQTISRATGQRFIHDAPLSAA
jgi:type II secretory pathway component GspD/PulD (secretin)